MCDQVVLQQKTARLLEMIEKIENIRALRQAFDELRILLEELKNCPDDFSDLIRNCEDGRSEMRAKSIDYANQQRAWLDDLTSRYDPI